eukprot:469452-Prymnesium_polylepis.2
MAWSGSRLCLSSGAGFLYSSYTRKTVVTFEAWRERKRDTVLYPVMTLRPRASYCRCTRFPTLFTAHAGEAVNAPAGSSLPAGLS